MTKINHSLEWAQIQIDLERPAKKLKRYSNDMLQISTNIGRLVKQLSEEEINCRRQGRQTKKHQELLTKINEEINTYEQMLTFGVLLNG
jgi:hypothetical protein